MRKAIEEGFILDVLANYTSNKTYYRLANRLSADDPVLPKRQGRQRAGPVCVAASDELAQKAEIIVEHFRAYTAAKIGGKAKAVVVTRSRLCAVKCWRAITKYVTDKGSDRGVLVAFSGSVIDPDLPNMEYRESMLNGFGEAALPKKFAGDEFQVLIVAGSTTPASTSRFCSSAPRADHGWAVYPVIRSACAASESPRLAARDHRAWAVARSPSW